MKKNLNQQVSLGTAVVACIASTMLAIATALASSHGDKVEYDYKTKRAIGHTFRDCNDVCPEMVVISPGSFEMGLEDNASKAVDELDRENSTPRHKVEIRYPFALGEYDVTRDEFSIFLHESGYRPDNDCAGYNPKTNKLTHNSGLNNPGFEQSDRDPVVCVNTEDIRAYISWLSRKTGQHYRLPSEAEWEYAARAGTITSRYWGADVAAACRYANVDDLTYFETLNMPPGPGDRYFPCRDRYAYTSPVGSFRPNRFGLFDMLGDVKQFTSDCWNYSYSGAPSDGTPWLRGDCMLRPVRGGSYYASPMLVTASFRYRQPSFVRSFDVGFRVAREL
jgi:sulfatase modifying factor 1